MEVSYAIPTQERYASQSYLFIRLILERCFFVQGVPPASVAEWTLEGDGNLDYYDVSLVDGFNIPMTVTNNQGCGVASCPVDLNPDCEIFALIANLIP